MNRRQRRETRRERPHRKMPDRYSADQLHRMLVQDAVDGVGPASLPSMQAGMTYMSWSILAYQRIADARRQTLDDAFIAVREEVVQRTGMDMPL